MSKKFYIETAYGRQLVTLKQAQFLLWEKQLEHYELSIEIDEIEQTIAKFKKKNSK